MKALTGTLSRSTCPQVERHGHVFRDIRRVWTTQLPRCLWQYMPWRCVDQSRWSNVWTWKCWQWWNGTKLNLPNVTTIDFFACLGDISGDVQHPSLKHWFQVLLSPHQQAQVGFSTEQMDLLRRSVRELGYFHDDPDRRSLVAIVSRLGPGKVGPQVEEKLQKLGKVA